MVPPPQRSDPLSGSSGGSTDLRVFQAWKGSNVSRDFHLFLFRLLVNFLFSIRFCALF